MTSRPTLKEFRIEESRDGIVHLVFDMPGRSMNVFSNSAIDDIGAFAAWLKASDVRGCVIRSGKTTAFCAGADLPEIEAAYDMVLAAPAEQRVKVAFQHFFRLSQGLRALETSGKPVAVAIAGLALGGGCELALACHHRVIANSPNSLLGLPESLVGLLPGAGGTQRMPRLVGLDSAFEALLDGVRFDAARAVAIGAAHEIAEAGQEVDCAERWILSNPDPRQPWDLPNYSAPDRDSILRAIEAERARRLELTQGHYPAPIAILDCLERGLVAPIDAALESEMDVFAHLIQRPEPRAMIRTMFIGRVEYDRHKAKGALPADLAAILDAALTGLGDEVAAAERAGIRKDAVIAAQNYAGFSLSTGSTTSGGQKAGDFGATADGYWFDGSLSDDRARLAAKLLFASARAVAPYLDKLSAIDCCVVDYAACRQIGFPAYVGGPLALARHIARRRASADA